MIKQSGSYWVHSRSDTWFLLACYSCQIFHSCERKRFEHFIDLNVEIYWQSENALELKLGLLPSDDGFAMFKLISCHLRKQVNFVKSSLHLTTLLLKAITLLKKNSCYRYLKVVQLIQMWFLNIVNIQWHLKASSTYIRYWVIVSIS